MKLSKAAVFCLSTSYNQPSSRRCLAIAECRR